METRAHHTLIGAFVLAFIAIGVGFALWIGKYQFDRQYAYYDIVFPGSVAGLNVGSDVRYQGILVGDVARIRVDPQQLENIRVTIRVEQRDDIVMRTTTRATLEVQGLTGGAFVQLSNPTSEGARLRVDYTLKGLHAEIQYEPSSLQSLFASFPELLKTGDELLRDLRSLVNEENRLVLTQILQDVRKITAAFADKDDDIRRIVTNTADLTGEATVLAQKAGVLVEDLAVLTKNLDGFLNTEGRALVTEVTQTLQSAEVLARDLSRVVRDNEEAVQAFASQGLVQLALFVSDARRLVVRLERFVRRVEADPSGLIFGGSRPLEVERRE